MGLVQPRSDQVGRSHSGKGYANGTPHYLPSKLDGHLVTAFPREVNQHERHTTEELEPWQAGWQTGSRRGSLEALRAQWTLGAVHLGMHDWTRSSCAPASPPDTAASADVIGAGGTRAHAA